MRFPPWTVPRLASPKLAGAMRGRGRLRGRRLQRKAKVSAQIKPSFRALWPWGTGFTRVLCCQLEV